MRSRSRSRSRRRRRRRRRKPWSKPWNDSMPCRVPQLSSAADGQARCARGGSSRWRRAPRISMGGVMRKALADPHPPSPLRTSTTRAHVKRGAGRQWTLEQSKLQNRGSGLPPCVTCPRQLHLCRLVLDAKSVQHHSMSLSRRASHGTLPKDPGIKADLPVSKYPANLLPRHTPPQDPRSPERKKK